MKTPHLSKICRIGLVAAMVWLSSTTANAQICTREYMPVCGQMTGEPAPRTFPNRCVLHAAGARLLSPGPCASAGDTATLPPALPAPVISEPPIAGGDADAHGCKASAGYQWNAELASCVRPWLSQTVTLEVSAQRRLCNGLIEAQCLLVRELTPGQKKPEWHPLHDRIEGFDPKPGVHYTLRVRKDRMDPVPADAPDTRYSLLKVLR